MKRALIQGTRICEIADADFPVAEGLTWVDVADDTTTQDTYENGAVVKYAAPALTWSDIRATRNNLLAASDWRAMSDVPVMSNEWRDYRQALRDIPATYSSPSDVVWPVEPD
jgi:hypothetical protein